MSKYPSNRFQVVIVYEDGDIDIAGDDSEDKVRAVVDEIIREPEGIASVSCFDRGHLMAGMRFEWVDGHARPHH